MGDNERDKEQSVLDKIYDDEGGNDDEEDVEVTAAERKTVQEDRSVAVPLVPRYGGGKRSPFWSCCSSRPSVLLTWVGYFLNYLCRPAESLL